jgi:subtilisin family serine protease
MKHYSLKPFIVVFFLSITTYCYSQQTSLLIKISNTTSYPNSTMGNSGLVTGNSSFNNYLTSINAQNLVPLYPSLHNPSANYPTYLNEAKKWYVIRVDEASKAQVANTINQNPSLYGVQFALQYNKPIPLHTPNDYNWPAFTLATPPNSGQAWDGYMAPLDAIKAKEAWDYTKGNPNVKIAIIDEGFDMDHEELSGNKVKYVNFQNALNKDHGTAVSTLAAGNTNNGKGLSAIGYNCSLLLYAYYIDPTVGSELGPFECILQAVTNGANVINCSFGTPLPSNPSPQILEVFATEQNIVRYAYEQNVFVVASAGNGTQNGFHTNATDYIYPASYDYVFSVTSTFEDAINPPYFQQTPTPNLTHQVNDKVDLAAPGFRIWHATGGLNPSTNTHNYYGWGDGTSFSGPIVAGTAGLLLSINPS